MVDLSCGGKAVVIHGDALHIPLEDNWVDAIVCDPPYGLEFMGKEWDKFGKDTGNHAHREKPRFTSDHMGKGFDKIPNTYEAGQPFQSWCQQWAREALRVLKPGGHLLAFGGSRTSHRLACGIEDAGFEIRDSITWLYGTGFPKSLDVSKAIDKAAGAARVVVTAGAPVKRMIPGADQDKTGSWIKDNGRVFIPTQTTAATEAARQWEGWGTALKPASEPIIVARKSFIGTVAANVQMYGTGAINIDACRVEAHGRPLLVGHGEDTAGKTTYGSNGPGGGSTAIGTTDTGRWPANVVLSHRPDCVGECVEGCAVAELDEQGGLLTSGKVAPGGFVGPYKAEVFGKYEQNLIRPETVYGDSGGASRYFPAFRYQSKAGRSERPEIPGVPQHPTVKPVQLMRWLARLVTPPGGFVLDPFVGSGSTGIACLREGFWFLGIDRDLGSVKRAQWRLQQERERRG